MWSNKLEKSIKIIIIIILTGSFILLKNYDYVKVLWGCYALYAAIEIYKVIILFRAKNKKQAWIEIAKTIGMGIVIELLYLLIMNSPNM